MTVPIKAKRLRGLVPDVIERARQGARFIVPDRRRRASHIVLLRHATDEPIPLADDPLYQAIAVGVSSDGRCSTDHDALLYSR